MNGFALMIEGLVAVLLLLTVGSCILLNNRLKKLKADEHALKATISELITATEIAERAIAGLKLTVRDCDQNLGERLRSGERLAESLDRQIGAGEEIVRKLAQIAAAARPEAVHAAPPMPAGPNAQATALAAQAVAARARARLNGVAA